ncbi:helix-turn-helix domain-containing protein [Candidatus Stoquefichus sp. SB1]|jgi:transcriptional regulator with XRE-family HTH domain|uniref:helix-turn-helix domain-containing protein n=1 Tax=Candidatus Stoquefichus sp. SB1 TaxID=1658109 RepID=UPI00067EFA50|nr:XRE family transcriptional regulator [Candidatus Stoquefichus sp. SB1]
MNIGGKIKRLRIANQLTLEELANRSELTKGFLSQVERNLTSPSIATLEDILEALGTSLHEFFNETQDEQIVFKKDDYFVNTQDDYVISYIVPNAQKNEMEPILIELAKAKMSMEMEPHDGEEFGYVISGKIKLHYGQKAYVVNKGETFYLSGKRTHYLENCGDAKAKVIWISTPPLF